MLLLSGLKAPPAPPHCTALLTPTPTAGTSGCVSLSDGSLLVPEIEVSFTLGQSLDSENKIQLEWGAMVGAQARSEAGATGWGGGVLPDHPIPSTVENLVARMAYQRDQV